MAKVLTSHAPVSHIGAESSAIGPASHQALCLWLRKSIEDGSKPSCVGYPEEAQGSWLQLGSASTIAATWGVNEKMEDLPLCLSYSQYN